MSPVFPVFLAQPVLAVPATKSAMSPVSSDEKCYVPGIPRPGIPRTQVGSDKTSYDYDKDLLPAARKWNSDEDV